MSDSERQNHRASRRMFLRGVGVTMALPWLESVPVWGADPISATPKRFAALFMGCGVNPANWWAVRNEDPGDAAGRRRTEPSNAARKSGDRT